MFAGSPKISLSKSQKNYELIYFSKIFLPKRSSGQVECSFDNPGEKLMLKVRTFSAQSPRQIKSDSFFSEIFLPKRSLGQLENSFKNPAKNFSFEV